MVSKILKFGKQKGSSLMLRANGQGGSSATVLVAHFAKRNTKFGGGGKARAGKNSFPPTPFPRTRTSSVRDFAFCPPELKSFSKFSVRIFAKKSSDFVQRSEPNCMLRVCCLGASRLGRQTRLPARQVV